MPANDTNYCECTNCSCLFPVNYLSMTNNRLCNICGSGRCNRFRTSYLK